MGDIVKHNFLLFGLGYIIAVLIAVFVTELFMFAPTVFPDGGEFGSFFNTLESALTVFWAGILYTFVTAFPGFILTIVFAKWKNEHSILFYCVCGILTTLLAHCLLALFIGGQFVQGVWIIVCSIPGGAAGAYAYYRWRSKILSA